MRMYTSVRVFLLTKLKQNLLQCWIILYHLEFENRTGEFTTHIRYSTEAKLLRQYRLVSYSYGSSYWLQHCTETKINVLHVKFNVWCRHYRSHCERYWPRLQIKRHKVSRNLHITYTMSWNVQIKYTLSRNLVYVSTNCREISHTTHTFTKSHTRTKSHKWSV